ncbi:hypothetical protein BB561_002060 [Smittium simulii]|uniref:Periplasmic binding protein-like II n=1 Tax=Smittium simulii TaxID=133385 RepID=A0A2T9YRW6_9FUNG|nr:hypothetical protein BB561_002060 [Smittium simulii]
MKLGLCAILLNTFVLASLTVEPTSSESDLKNTGIDTKCSRELEDIIDQLYKEAYTETYIKGKGLVVYEGGDSRNQQLASNISFNTRFPGLNATFVVDLSKYHTIEINKQIKSNSLIPSVANIQTIADIYDWKKEGLLLPFKPLCWENVYPELKDPEYHFISVTTFPFGPNALRSTVESGESPIEDEDFLNPKFKNRIVLTYPQDDDAVLFKFHKLVENNGWDYIYKLVAQNVTWIRGTETPLHLIANGTIENGVTFTSFNYLTPAPDSRVVIKIPEKSWFNINFQFAGIFKDAPNPAAAKLYIAWKLSEQMQKSDIMSWPTRSDIPPKIHQKRLNEYPNSSITDYAKFMLNREYMAELRAKFDEIIGPVKGDTPLNLV